MKFEKISFEQFKKDYEKYFLQTHNALSVNETEIKKIYEEIRLPERSTKNSAGYDFRLPYPITALPFSDEDVLYPTGIKCVLDSDKVLMLFPRSSLGMNYGFQLLNTVGVIDADYYNNEKNEGHIMLKFKINRAMELDANDKIFQGIIMQYFTTEDDKADGVRKGGMGSTNA